MAASWKETGKELIGLDFRSLALFRICLGFLLILDLMRRAHDLTAHYTDEGVLPRKALLEISPTGGSWFSLHFINGSTTYEALLFIIAAVFAFGLLIGFHSHLMTLLSWILLIFLDDRNTMILHGGDALLRTLVFWGFFLPLGTLWSVDRILSTSSPPSVKTLSSLASFAYLLQICIIYWQAVGFKWNHDWLSGFALEYALNIDQFATDAGIWLKAQKPLLPTLTYFTLFLEGVGPLLLFFPFFNGPIRTLVAFLFMIMHVSFGFFLAIGLFSPICITAWLCVLPPWFWDVLLPTLFKPLRGFFKATGIARGGDFVHSYFKAVGAEISDWILKHFHKRPLRWKTTFIENLTAGFLIVYVALGSVYLVNPEWMPLMNQTTMKLGNALRINQPWNMFSQPLREDGWYVIEGGLLSGEKVDLARQGKPITWEKPEYVYKLYENDRWRKYMMNLWWKSNYKHRGYFADYLCRQWNESHQNLQKLVSIKIYYNLKKTNDDLTISAPEKILIWSQECHPKKNESVKSS